MYSVLLKHHSRTEGRDYTLTHLQDYDCLIVAEMEWECVCGFCWCGLEMLDNTESKKKKLNVAILLTFFCVSLFADDWNRTASNPSLLERFLLIRNCAECKITQHSSHV